MLPLERRSCPRLQTVDKVSYVDNMPYVVPGGARIVRKPAPAERKRPSRPCKAPSPPLKAAKTKAAPQYPAPPSSPDPRAMTAIDYAMYNLECQRLREACE